MNPLWWDPYCPWFYEGWSTGLIEKGDESDDDGWKTGWWSSNMIYGLIRSCIELSRSREWTLGMIKDKFLQSENELYADSMFKWWTRDSQILEKVFL